MPNIDENVVSMQFDNKAFEKNLADTIASLDKLRASLDVANAGKTFTDITAASKNVNLSSIASAVDHIAGRFTAMGAIAFSVLQSVTTQAVHAGERIIKSLSLDQVISGFQEYQTNINSIQTILANTRADATTLQDVNKALDELNAFADQTIYNFSQMTKNIGTFTAAGIDLNTSVTAIKGIANLAAISGSNAEQASSAMYQLSQALASGTLKLMDWNSVVNAGMGGEVFQKALFETGKALGTIKDVPISETFDEWKNAGNSFRGSLEQGWITAEVLTNTLQGFTGDLTEAQILSLGFTQEQVAGIQEMGQVGKEAATKVKTLSQLIDTTKEAIGSGWSESFRIIIGTFDEAKEVFSDFASSIGTVVQASSNARNEILQGWKDMGGRAVLIDTIKLAFTALGKIINVIKAAFHDIFPKATATALYNLTLGLYGFIHNLLLSRETLWDIRHALSGFFALISIGFEIVKEFGKMVFEIFSGFSGGGALLDFFANLGIKLTELKKKLVDEGGIVDFFDNLGDKIAAFLEFISPITDGIIRVISNFVGKIFDFFNGLSVGNALDKIKNLFSGLRDSVEQAFPQEATDKIKERVSSVGGVFEKLHGIFERFWDFLGEVAKIVGKVADKIREAFSGLPQAIADAFSNTDYESALDTVNTGLFAGLIVLFRKFVQNPVLGKDFAKTISKSLETLTGTLKAMQTDLKAQALLKIAGAIALLTASLVVMSLMDSAALTKAMIAISAGLALLVAGMTVMDKLLTGGAAVKLSVLSTALIGIATSLLILAGAVKIFSTMSWEELAKGLTGVAVALGVLAIGLKLMPNEGALVRQGASLLLIATALNILAGAVKIFATMSWEELGKGMAAVATALVVMGTAMRLFPSGPTLVLQGAGIVAIAFAMNLLAAAMKIMATMSWEDIAKGITGIAGGLFAIGLAMKLFGNGRTLVLQSIGLVAIGGALLLIASSMKIMATISWEEMARGLAGIAGSLLILAGISHLMSGNVLGAIAIGVMAASLLILSHAVKEMAKLKWSELGKGLGIMAITLAALAAAALLMQPAIPALLALGAALLVVGAALALFGLGANLLATAFAVLATSGTQGVETLLGALTVLAQALPGIIAGLAEGIIKSIDMFLDKLPGMVVKLSGTIAAFIQLIRDNIPGLVAAAGEFISALLSEVTRRFPELVATGLSMLLALLQGIRDHIGEITTLVAEIIVEFLTSLTAKMPDIVDAGLGLVVAFVEGITKNLASVVEAAVALIAEFLIQLGNNADTLVSGIVSFLTNVLLAIASGIDDLASSILQVVTAIVNSMVDFLSDVVNILVDGFVNFILDVLSSIATSVKRLASGISSMLKTIVESMVTLVLDFVSTLVDGVFTFLIKVMNDLAAKIRSNSGALGTAFGNLMAAIVEGIAKAFTSAGIAFFGSLASAIGGFVSRAIGDVPGRITSAISGFVQAMFEKIANMVAGAPEWLKNKILDALKNLWNQLWDTLTGWFPGCPAARSIEKLGENFMWHLVDSYGNTANAAAQEMFTTTDDLMTRVANMSSTIVSALEADLDMNPTITPVLDLTEIARGSSELASMLASNSNIRGDLSYSQAASIATSRANAVEPAAETVIPTKDVTFVQNNISPALPSRADIYRQTRNQIALAKEELAKI